jgi:uncharacterized protein (DUF2126 family)
MAIKVALHHRTSYRYDRPAVLSPQTVRLRPAPHCRTAIESYSLKVEPLLCFTNWQQDPHGNFVARLVFPEPAAGLVIDVDLIADMTVVNPFDFFLEPGAERFPFEYEPALKRDLAPFLKEEQAGPGLAELLARIDRTPRPTVDFLVELNRHIHGMVRYLIRMDPGVQTFEETLASQSGSCRDSAWLMVQVLRHLGLAARFVSGYLIQLAPDLKPIDGPPGPSADFTDLHAWTEVYLPGAGWVGLDATSGLLAGEGHIPLAATPEPQTAAPITGSVSPCEVEFAYSMSVQRLDEKPRVTRPYSDEAWERIDALGQHVDRVLGASDVRLTMGGEPTFVSIDDMQGEEWNTAALGPNKRLLADRLVRRLRERFAPGGLLHFGAGKWYPGESLPRWSFSCYWRRDGIPLWEKSEWIASEGTATDHSAADAKRFIHELAGRLGVGDENAIPAYEDVWHYLCRERKLPVNVDPLESHLDDPEERERLARIFERGLGSVVGYALPLAWRPTAGAEGWVSGPWFFRQETMYLLPGDSPMGFRLPLESLPWSLPADPLADAPIDPFAPRGPLPDPRQRQLAESRPRGVESADRRVHQTAPSPADWARTDLPTALMEPRAGTRPDTARTIAFQNVVRTAVCVEPRDGRLCVFLPPVRGLLEFVDLIAAIEATAADLQMPVALEGYPPPSDHRLNHLKVTPDPGVIEVNVHPSHDWPQLVQTTTDLYDDARQCRLGTEKFMLDGRHSGTGGGNHVVLGGPTPAESPFLRRPDVLAGLVLFWQHHPSLSYLFSTLFVGPTSQAPRIDEGRHDSLAELELAIERLPKGGACPPWLADRLFRHLLVDVTGNTHRAEFCIDKLFSPDTATGRQGLVELRAFEMPPHARMSLAQQLLVRAVVARLWNDPYLKRPARWGTALSDRFLLPEFVWHDFRDVLDDLSVHGFRFEPEWFTPHFEFRFPVLGRLARRGLEIELRQAIEPWHVLGEEPEGPATARYVDSSVERMQVCVTGMNDSRHVVVVNGRPLPLFPTGTSSEYVAGVRYRAWQPPHCLHPTIPVDTPIVLDVYDKWLGRSIGGCTYHVSHPGGRNYETFPVNAAEAESRRSARFFPWGHTAGTFEVPPVVRHAEHPMTLDLRRI